MLPCLDPKGCLGTVFSYVLLRFTALPVLRGTATPDLRGPAVPVLRFIALPALRGAATPVLRFAMILSSLEIHYFNSGRKNGPGN